MAAVTRGFRQTLCTPGPRDPTETETELCLSVSCGGTGQQWTATGVGALGTADRDMAQALLEEVTIKPTIEPPELTQDWGNRLMEDTNKTLYMPVTPQETDPDLPISVQESPVEA